MNITVVTPYDSSNFGAYLQAYCMNAQLKSLGHRVTFLPTRPSDYVESLFFTRTPASRKEKLLPAVYKRHLEFGKRKYELFRRAWDAFSITDDLSDTDLVILGSDEVWNAEKPVFHASVFWGDLRVPSVSYAASIGDADPGIFSACPDQTDQIRKLKRALVRDENTRQFVETYTDLTADLVCDPTILWPAASYGEECTDEYVRTHDCLLVYAYTVSKRERRELRRYARAKNLRIVTCCFYHSWSDHQVECGPLAFSDLIRRCRLFYTSSFHGTIFGMLNHANFAVSTDNPKTMYLVRQYGLENRYLSKREMSADGLAGIYARKKDFAGPDQCVRDWRRRSKALLEDAIAGISISGEGGGESRPGKESDPLICFHNRCTGCFACRAVCPEGAISIVRDAQGRTLPRIDSDKCTGCNACRTICPQRSAPRLLLPQKCYAARGTDSKKISNSSSGGIAAILSASFVRAGNTVCGSLVENGKAVHRLVREEKDLPLLQGSKYVQSDVSEVYDEVRRELGSGRQVLFFGTPCQVDAMKRFFGKNKNFYAADIICHGVPPMEFLDRHLREVTEGKAYDRFRFRGSPDDFTLKVFGGQDVLYSKTDVEDTYFYAFLNSLTYRENCYNCPYARTGRTGDITIGDFWGIDTKTLKNRYDGNISVILVNTDRGRDLLDRIRPDLVCEERAVSEAVEGNPQLRRPSMRHPGRVRFLQSYMDHSDFSAAIAASGIQKAMKRMQFGRTGPGKVYVFLKKAWQKR